MGSFLSGAKVYLIGGAVVTAIAFGGGYKVASWRYGLKIAKIQQAQMEVAQAAADKAREAESLGRQLNDAISEADALRNQEREVVERIITQERIEYVEVDNSRECGLDTRGVFIHDTAARGDLSGGTEPPAASDDGTVEATNNKLIGVVTENYATCHAIRDQLLSLQEWAKSIGEL